VADLCDVLGLAADLCDVLRVTTDLCDVVGVAAACEPLEAKA
ncbi:hypothetical protein Tco_0192529, partial [Tanacetum coccineum]